MFEEYQSTTLQNADIALKHRLYVSGWELSRTLVEARNQPENVLVLLHYEDERPVGVLIAKLWGFIRHDRKHVDVQVFVRKSFRKRGIGSQLISKFKEVYRYDHPIIYSNGIVGSEVFWSKCFPEHKRLVS